MRAGHEYKTWSLPRYVQDYFGGHITLTQPAYGKFVFEGGGRREVIMSESATYAGIILRKVVREKTGLKDKRVNQRR